MKILVSVVSLAMLIPMHSASAEEVQVPCGGGGSYTITIPAGVASNGKSCTGALSIDNRVKIIGRGAFSGKSSITSVVIPEGVQIIEPYGFYLNKITKLVLPNSLTSVGEHAFSDNLISEIQFGNSLQETGNNSFDTNKLTSLNLPDSLIQIGYLSFFRNENLSSIVYCGSSIENLPVKPICPAGRKKTLPTSSSSGNVTNPTNSPDVKKFTILCKKGKSVKSVAGDPPTCPKGYTNSLERYPTYQAFIKCKLYKKDKYPAAITLKDEGKTINFPYTGNVSKYFDSAASYEDVECALKATKAPSYIDAQIQSTRALDGMQKATWGRINAFWNYSPSNGLDITIYYN